MRSALRELNQKRLKNASPVLRVKRAHRRGLHTWACPRCGAAVPRLTAAHVGRPVVDIIDEAMRTHPRRDLFFLDAEVRRLHADVRIVVCCDTCNAALATRP